jgi:hypothetical protein
MNPARATRLRQLAEAGEAPPAPPPKAPPATSPQPGGEGEIEQAPAQLDPSREDEIRSATHAILGHALGTSVYDSGYASEMVDMVERLAKDMEVPPAEIVRVMRGTMERWRYMSKMTLSDGTQLNLGLKIEVQ